jgi:hypothetical protein
MEDCARKCARVRPVMTKSIMRMGLKGRLAPLFGDGLWVEGFVSVRNGQLRCDERDGEG